MSSDTTTVKVAVRVRPLVPSETARGCRDILEIVQENSQIIVKRIDKDSIFTFNYVLSTDSTQDDLYNGCVKPLIGNLFKGYNVTILAYGQTGSGKTHSMGTAYSGEDDAGVIPRAVRDIFAEKKDNFCFDFSITVSFMELYQEVLYDLLSNRSREDSVLELREDSKKGICIPGLSEVTVESAQELLNVLQKGSSGRATGATAMNAQSSRSHAICCINVSMNHKTDSRENKQARLNLVDLAGSERPKKTGAVGNTFKEGVNINKGLFVLGNVISCLGDEKAQNGFIPYRDSNLTRLLKDSLGGNSITLMVACVSPADYNLDETLSTLRYADRARKIKNKPIVNQDAKVAEINQLKKTIQQLKLQILGQGGPMVCPAQIELLQLEILDLKQKLKKMTIQFSGALADNTHLHERLMLLQSVNETLNQKIATLKDQCEETFTILNGAICEQDTNSIKDNIEKLHQIHNDFLKINTEQRETEEEIKFHEKAFNDNLLINKNDKDINEEEASNEVMERQETHATRQMELNIQLKEMHKELALKEGLVKTLAINNQNIVDIQEMADNEKKIETLEQEKSELQKKLKTAVGSSDKLNIHKKRIQELEIQLSNLNRKVKEQARLIEHKNKSELKINKLNQDILQIKQAKVKLIRAMREEADKFKHWRLEKERECQRLKQQERKKENELMKMKLMHSKQATVFKRRVEEAEALNKRLKNALALRKQVVDTKKAGQIDKIEPWLKQEYELFVDIVAAEATLKQLLNDRAILKQQLDEMTADSENPVSEEAIKSVADDIEVRSLQIQDLQAKILDSDEENRSKTRLEKFQSMAEAKYGLRFLFAQAEVSEQEKVQMCTKLNELQYLVKEQQEKIQELEDQNRAIEERTNTKLMEQQKEYEEHMAILLGNRENLEDPPDADMESVLSNICKNQREQIEAQELLIQQLQEEKNQAKPKVTFLTPIKQEAPLGRQVISNSVSTPIHIEDSPSFVDNSLLDPEWQATPLGKRILEMKKKRSEYSRKESGLKRSSKGSCSCTTKCTLRCGCRKAGRGCNTNCRCSESCENRNSENIDPEPSTSSKSDELLPETETETELPRKRRRGTKTLFSSNPRLDDL